MTYIPILQNPTEFNGSEAQKCERCHNDLTNDEVNECERECFDCIKEQEQEGKYTPELSDERKDLLKRFMEFPTLEKLKEL